MYLGFNDFRISKMHQDSTIALPVCFRTIKIEGCYGPTNLSILVFVAPIFQNINRQDFLWIPHYQHSISCFLVDIDPILPKFHSCSLVDIDLICKIFKNLLNESSSFVAPPPPVFTNTSKLLGLLLF